MILDYTYFQGKLALPNVRHGSHNDLSNVLNIVGTQSLEWFIAKYEPEFLRNLLGDKLFNAFKEGREQQPTSQKWIDLEKALYWQDGIYKFSPAANYVYFFIKENLISQTTVHGEKRGTMDYGADSVNETDKQVSAWYDMCKMIEDFYRFMRDNMNSYDGLGFAYKDLKLVNEFNI